MSTDLSVQERLARYLIKNALQKIAKGALADLAREKMGVTGETVGRRLRILHEASFMSIDECPSDEHIKALSLLEGGVVQVEYREKQHAWYWYEPPKTKMVRKVRIIGMTAHEYYETINSTV